MPYNLDLRFAAPVLFNLFIYLIRYFTSTGEQANRISVSNHYIDNQISWLCTMLALFLLVFVIFVKLSIYITVFAESLMLQFGYFNLSVPLIVLSIASFVLPPQLLLYVYMVCACIWITPLPSCVFQKFMNQLQQLPVFIIMAQQQADDQELASQYLEGDYEEDYEDAEINFILGHA